MNENVNAELFILFITKSLSYTTLTQPYPNSIQGPSASGNINCLKLLHIQQGEMSIVHGIIVLRDTLETPQSPQESLPL